MKQIIFLILFILCFGTGVYVENATIKDFYKAIDANSLLQKKLDDKLIAQHKILGNTEIIKLVDSFDISSDLYKELKSESLSLFAYKNKCLVFWSNNVIQPYNFPTNDNFNKQFLSNNKGWYQMVSLKKGEYDIYCFYHFYRHYPIANEYFANGFSTSLNFNNLDLKEFESNVNYNSTAFVQHKTLPEVDQKVFEGVKVKQLVELLYFFAFLFFAVFAFLFANSNHVFKARVFMILFASFVSLFNLFAFLNIIIKQKSNSSLFSPDLAAYSDFMPSLGHSILFSMFLLSLMVVIHQAAGLLPKNDAGKTSVVRYLVVSSAHWAFNLWVVFIVIPTYVLNSRISYDFKYLSNVNENTLIGMFNVFMLFLFLLLGNRILGSFLKNRIDKRKFYTIHFIIALCTVIFAYLVRNENGFLLICFSVFGMLLPIWGLFVKRLLFRHIMAVAFITAAVFSVQFEQLNSHKEKENRKLFANKLITKEDIDLELKLLEIEEEMIHSAAIDSFFYYKKTDYSELELNYCFTYFNEFIKNYDITLMRYDSFGNAITPNKLTYEYVNELYNKSTNKSISNYFLYIRDLHYLGGYLAKYEICPDLRNIGYVYLLLTPKLKSDQYNLEYFFSKMDDNHLADDKYSYAVYQNNVLIRGLGAFPYRLTDYKRYLAMDDETFLVQNGFSQLLKKIDNETFIIVSLKSSTWNQIFTVFTSILLYFTSILIAVFILIYSLIFIIGRFSFNPFFAKLHDIVTQYLRVININNLYLETKIRLSFLLMSVLICSVVVYFTVQNVNKGFKEKQNDALDKKMSQIVSELEVGYNKRDEKPIQNLIKHLANTHEVDINLYYKDGTLFQAATNRIYNEGWFSPYIHPNAHYELIHRSQYSFKQTERIGKLEYLSYYTALFDEDRNLFGYVHLPYFSKSKDLKTEFSTYLGSLLNMSTLLLMISLLIASYIGQSLVRPLNLMIESLARIRVGAQNKSIDWNRNDEIGQLVEQYNSMLKKLEVSTEKLARSEREGAWKEMAKQVAHEIKNPLTPMKLHLQHLQLSISRNDENLKEKFAGISTILIDQIDQLSRMAEEFSSFAKMPLANPQVCNIYEVLSSCILLFRSQNDIEITYTESEEALYVFVDKDQLLRVFTNILKNAQQAALEGIPMEISVTVDINHGYVTISFTDNGKGIEDALKDKIFQPNFSTKNSGMGLGLAICKKIIEQVNGNITFSSEVNKGSTFNVILPIYKDDLLSNT